MTGATTPTDISRAISTLEAALAALERRAEAEATVLRERADQAENRADRAEQASPPSATWLKDCWHSLRRSRRMRKGRMTGPGRQGKPSAPCANNWLRWNSAARPGGYALIVRTVAPPTSGRTSLMLRAARSGSWAAIRQRLEQAERVAEQARREAEQARESRKAPRRRARPRLRVRARDAWRVSWLRGGGVMPR